MMEKLVGNKSVYGFANLHLFTSLSLSNTSSIHLEKERYVRLIEDAFLDSLKVYYYHKIQKLNVVNKPGLDDPLGTIRRKRHLSMIEATHLIYQYFSNPAHNLDNQPTFADFLQSLHAAVRSPVINDDGTESRDMLELYPIDLSILKALTQYPFTQYEPLRKAVFKWIIELLDAHINRIDGEIGHARFSNESFRGLKFIVRRAALMNANYLISPKMFDALNKLYTPDGIPAIKARQEKLVAKDSSIFREKEQKELDDINTFPVFFSAQIKELLSKNSFRSILLEPLLHFTGSGGMISALKHLMRMLRAENAIIIQKFYEWLRQDSRWEELYFHNSSNKFSGTDNKPIENLLQSNAIKSHHFYRSLEEFMRATGQEKPVNNEPFKNYLWIRNYLDMDARIEGDSLTDRTARIFNKLRQIFEALTPSGTGIFLSIPNGDKDSYLVYDQNSEGVAEIDSNSWLGEKNTYLQEFLMGKKTDGTNYYHTLVELKKFEMIRGWKDLYHDSLEQITLGYDFLGKDIDRLLLMRLSKRTDILAEKPIGMIGIYFKRGEEAFTDTNSVRYLLLLKEALAGFVERHHHNNEFRDWLNAENTKRLALLSGHGKEMLKALAAKEGLTDNVYKVIAWNLEHLQAIILLQDSINGGSRLDNIQATFNKFYDVSGSMIIDKDYFTRLKVMADQIYEFEEVETYVECKVSDNCPPDFNFAFNQKILNLICFELFINAKKNRWHFQPEDRELITQYDVNVLEINVSLKKEGARREMVIGIMNIGPPVNESVFNKLNSETGNVKPNDITAGTSLLKILVKTILGGEIKFYKKEVCKITGLQEFTVFVTLPEMN